MTATDLLRQAAADMRRRAQAATPGPWAADLTAAGKKELAAYDQAVARVSRVAPVVTRTVTRRGQVA